MSEPTKSSALIARDQPGVVSLGDAAPVVANGIVSRTILATPELRAILFSFAPEQALTEHTNPARAVVHILTGECEFSVAGQPRTLRAGDLLHIPPSAPHAVRATTAMSMLLVLSPVRKEEAGS